MKAYGSIGQSNEFGLSVWAQNPSPPSGASLARLRYWMVDLFQFTDAVGSFVPLDFAASRMDFPTSGFDWPMENGIPAYLHLGATFGPGVYSGLAMADFWVADVAIVKLAPGGTYLTALPPGPPFDPQSWFWPHAHHSWDPSLPRDSTPFTTVTKDTGTATATSPITFSDSTKNWVVNEHVNRWVRLGGREGLITANSDKVATVFWWTPDPLGAPPALVAYTIEQRHLFEASLIRTWLEGYCAAAKAADPTFDLDGVFMCLGESDGLEFARAVRARANFLNLIWYVRTTAVALGLTTLAAHRIKFVIAKIKEGNFGAYADLVNKAFTEIAAADPYVRIVHVDDITLGGFHLPGTFDPIHYDANGQIVLGKRRGAAMVDMLTAPEGARRSIRYAGRHVVVRPLWGVGAGSLERFIPTLADLAAVPTAQIRYPAFYLMRDSEPGAIAVWLDEDGRTMTNSGHGGTLVGYARAVNGPGMVPLESVARVDTATRRAARGQRGGNQINGYVWRAGAGDFDPFGETQVVNGNFTLWAARGVGGAVTRLKTTVPAASIDREWLLRGHRGSLSLSATMRIDEKVGLAGTLWMRHLLGLGDYTEPQVVGVGACKLPPTIEATADATATDGSAVPLDFSPDAGAPVPAGLIVQQVNHGGAAAASQGVLWPETKLRQRVEPSWRGIVGCIRVVHQFEAQFAIGGDLDEVAFEPACWAQNTFDKQFVYDPATTVETDLSWNPTDNRYHEITIAGRTTFNKNGTVFSTGATWLTRQAGLIGWQATGVHGAPADNLVWALYNKLGISGRVTMPTLLRLGNWTEPLAGAAGGFAAHDQRNYAYAKAVFASTGTEFPAGYVFRVAVFLLSGTMAQVKAAADALYALGVDATWTE